MKIQYGNNFVQKFQMGDPRTCIYQCTYDEKYNNDTQIIQCFIMNGLLLCIKVYSYVELFYIHGHSVTIQQPPLLKIRTNNHFP